MGSFAGHVLPGVYFILLGSWLFITSIYRRVFEAFFVQFKDLQNFLINFSYFQIVKISEVYIKNICLWL